MPRGASPPSGEAGRPSFALLGLRFDLPDLIPQLVAIGLGAPGRDLRDDPELPPIAGREDVADPQLGDHRFERPGAFAVRVEEVGAHRFSTVPPIRGRPVGASRSTRNTRPIDTYVSGRRVRFTESLVQTPRVGRRLRGRPRSYRCR